MLAVHASWSADDRELLVWAEDGELPPALPPGPGRPPPGRPAARRPPPGQPAPGQPPPHPFAASSSRVAEVLGDLGAFAGVSAETSGSRGTSVLWLPGAPGAPHASPQLVRQDPDTPPPGAPARRDGGRGASALALHPFEVPVLRLGPGAALDLLLAATSPGTVRPGLHVGDSVRALGAVAELALEVVAGGRFLPDLVVEGGRHLARWTRAPAPRG